MVLAALLAVVLFAHCGPTDPRAKIQEQRARWNVQILSWAQNAEGTVHLDTRVSGPPNSSLTRLTVRIQLLGLTEQVLQEKWHTFDLTEIPRGGPRDILIRIPAPGAEIEGLGLSQVLEPDAEEIGKIPELNPGPN